MIKQVVNGSGWTIVKEGPESVTIRLKDPRSLNTSAYRNAVASLCNVKNVRIVCAFIN